jgi:hypothetical protein
MIAYTILPHGRAEGSPGFTVAAVEANGHTMPIMIYETEAEAWEARRHIEQGDRITGADPRAASWRSTPPTA